MTDIEDIQIAACELFFKPETSLDEFSESEKKSIIFKRDFYQKKSDELLDLSKRAKVYNICHHDFINSINETASKLIIAKLQRKVTTNK